MRPYLINTTSIQGGDSALLVMNSAVLESEEQRLLQAQVVHDFVAEMLAVDQDANIVVMGDLNDFQFSAPVLLLQGDLLTTWSTRCRWKKGIPIFMMGTARSWTRCWSVQIC